jgi:hypothetical protein
MLNLETIGGTIIEVHLRFADQWLDLYGPGWVDAVVRLYETGFWDFADSDRRGGYSVVLFGPNGERYRHPPRIFTEAIKRTPGISSVQITFHEDLAPELHAMPPGGFRLAVVNGFDLATALSARTRLEDHFVERRCVSFGYADDWKATQGRDHVQAALKGAEQVLGR